MTRLGRVTLLVLLATGLALTGCRDRSSPEAGRFDLDGRAEITEADGGTREVTRGGALRDGEQVRILDGTAVLSLGNGRELELRKDTTVRLVLEEVAGGGSSPRAQLLAGDLLVVAAEQPARVDAGETEILVTSGAARVSTGLNVTVATYQGAAGVETGGRPASVPALRQVSVPAPGLPSRATPLIVDPGDPWDQRYLGDAIDLGNQLGARSLGFTAQLRPGQATAAFFRQILPQLAAQPFDDSLFDPAMAPGETLVGAAIALESDRGSFAQRWEDVFGFHQEGASWGLVVLNQGADRAAVLATVDAAIARAPGLTPSPSPPPTGTGGGTGAGTGGGQAAAPGTGTTATTASPGGGTGSTGGSGTGTTTPGAGTGGTGTGTGTGSGAGQPAPLPHRGPIDLGLPVVDDTLNAVIDALSGLVRAIGSP
ncbi:MAG: hypothetical protein ACLGI2_03820 [Acidimicrobiia bacterium]